MRLHSSLVLASVCLLILGTSVACLPPEQDPPPFSLDAGPDDAGLDAGLPDAGVDGGLPDAGPPFLAPTAWTSGGALSHGRLGHTATRLSSGDVLVVGGEEYAAPTLAGVELFSASTGQWSSVASLPAARANHTATLLQDGRVLVVGGGRSTGELFPSGNVTAATALFDPTTRTWAPAGDLATARSHHAAIALADGRVLVIGGAGSTHTNGPRLADALASCELFDPATGTWSPTGSLHTARFFHTAVRLASGQVLVAGGANSKEEGFASAELFDPTTQTWTVTGSMSVDRLWHVMTVLASGRVLVAGGKRSNVAFLSSAEVFDPTTQTWRPAQSPGKVGNGAALVTLPDGRALLSGGYGFFSGRYERLTATALYDEVSDGWAAIGPLLTARALHTASLLADGRVLVIGGLGDVSDGIAACEVTTH